ncbi:MAG: DUF5131 family protein [Candidatus Nanopelagicales bacterium]
MPTHIEWTDETWNPVTGCSKVSQGCKHCYALREWPRLAANPATAYFGREFTDVACHPERLDAPLRWAKPRKIFVNSMSDLFHESVPDDFIDRVFAVMALCPQHTFQVLTKRPERMLRYMTQDDGYGRWGFIDGRAREIYAAQHGRRFPAGKILLGPLPNVWLIVSVEDQPTADERIPILLKTPAAVRGISAEPLLGPVDVEPWLYRSAPNCDKGFLQMENGEDGYCARCYGHVSDPIHTNPERVIDWVIVGGESGPKARPMHPDWVRSLRDQCAQAGVPLLFKQWGEWRPIDQMEEAEHSALYKSRVKASSWESQDAMDDIYGRACTVPTGVVHLDGSLHGICEPMSFLQGTCSMQTFRVGKKASGRLLDGMLHDAYPPAKGIA